MHGMHLHKDRNIYINRHVCTDVSIHINIYVYTYIYIYMYMNMNISMEAGRCRDDARSVCDSTAST